ncbi:MAG: redoxin family protein [Moraxellaceae bacterium]|nr:redoxin family protein [Moraxellaceae bacterium]MDZ4386643.1 redoxin family protein [Moraxellaceae bacterium]
MNNKLKSAFISSFIAVAVIFSLYGLYLISQGYLAGFGLVLAHGVWVVFFLKQWLRPVARIKPQLHGWRLLAVLGVLISGINGGVEWPMLAALGWLGGVFYSFWYGKLNRSATAIKVGDAMPHLPLLTADGQSTNTHEFAGKRLVFLFYRGNWCPFCVAQIRELAQQYQQLRAKGIELVLVSGQSQSKAKALAEQFTIPIHFRVDNDLSAAQALGLVHKDGLPAGLAILGYDLDVALPTLVAVDESGKVIAVDTTDDYRVRPEPETFMRCFDDLANMLEDTPAT